MPVSSPSYFPPEKQNDQIIGVNAGINYLGARCFLAGQSAGNNSTITDIVVIGDNTLSAGVTDQNADGSVAIGSGVLQNFIGSDGGANTGPVIAIGFNTMARTTGSASVIAIGSTVFGAMIGTGAANGGINNSIVIGHNAVIGQPFGGTRLAFTNSIVIGGLALRIPATAVASTVIVGYNAGNNALANNASILHTVTVGDNASISDHSVILGSGAHSYAAPASGAFAVEVVDTGVVSSILWGNLLTGNLVAGNLSVANRVGGGSGGANTLTLTNGGKGLSAPSGGGYFYVLNGSLHWVGSGGTDTTIASA